MSTATPAPAPAAAPEPTAPTEPVAEKRSFFRLPRREFFFGGLAGLAAGKVLNWVQPIEWTHRDLPKGTKLSFAQYGEDLVASGLFGTLNVKAPTYLDIGAYEPIDSNNTYLFYRRGARGVLVEPNVALTDKLKGTRPGDTT